MRAAKCTVCLDTVHFGRQAATCLGEDVSLPFIYLLNHLYLYFINGNYYTDAIWECSYEAMVMAAAVAPNSFPLFTFITVLFFRV